MTERSPSPPSGDAVLPIGVIAAVLERSRHVLLAGLAGAALGFMLALSSGGRFTSHTVLLPQGSQTNIAGLAGIAAQVGLMSGVGNTGSPRYYEQLLRSEAVLVPIIHSRFRYRDPGLFGLWSGDTVETTLREYFGAAPDDTVKAVMDVLEALRDAMRITTYRESGLLFLDVTVNRPELSQAVARALLNQLQVIDRTARREVAMAEARFSDERLSEARRALRLSEDSLEAFLASNRTFRDSPTLLFAYERLQRSIALQQGVVTFLAQAREQARLEATRNTPVAATVQEPTMPPRARPRRTLAKTLGGAMAGSCTAAGLIALAFIAGLLGSGPSSLARRRALSGAVLRSAPTWFRRDRPS